MIRDPGLHITKSNLKKYLIEWQKEKLPYPYNDELTDDQVNYLMKRGSNHSLSHRMILESANDTQKKSLNRLSSAKMDDATLFNTILANVRIQLKHRGFTRVTRRDTDWQFIVEISKLALEFSKAFDLEREQGFIEYIRGYFSMRGGGGFRLRQMKVFHESIVTRYECKIKIKADDTPDETEAGYKLYQDLVYDKTGVYPKYDKDENPEKYLLFVEVSKKANELGLTTHDYILANFESLASWTNGIPSPEQLVTLNARDRVIKWMSENKITRGKSTNIEEDKAILEFRRRKKQRRENNRK